MLSKDLLEVGENHEHFRKVCWKWGKIMLWKGLLQVRKNQA